MSAAAAAAAGDTPTLEELLELAIALAREAGELARATRAGGRPAVEAGMRHKSSSVDLATDADRAAEQLIRDRLAAARPGDAVLGEEGGRQGGTSGLVWVVDPIDGTTNFVYDYPSFAVSVAVAEDLDAAAPGPPAGGRAAGGAGGGHGGATTAPGGAPAPWPPAVGALLGVGRILAGVVHDPVHGETYSASLGGGAFLNGELLAVDQGASDLASSLIGTGFAYSAADRAVQARLLATVLPAVRDLRRGGAASLDLCHVAAGRVDGFYEADLHAWDVAAGMLVVAEAGAVVSVLDWLAPGPTVLAARPAIATQLEELLRLAAERAGE